jgi:2-methylcitrate dehydratase PrpD
MRPLSDPNLDFTTTFMTHALKVSLDDIDTSVLETTKLHLLDTIGVALAAPCSIGNEMSGILSLLNEWGGAPESTVWSSGEKLPAWAAAFANGALAKGLDFDTTHPTAMLHPSGPVIPATLALAETNHVPGSELLVSILMGEELMNRLGHAVTRRSEGWLQDWHTTILLGAFGSAAAASRVVGLTLDQAVGALGTALTCAGGTMELGFGTGSTLRLIYNAFPGRDGVMAAKLAQHGVLGPRTPIEGKAGLMAVHFSGSYDVDSLYVGLGEHYDSVGTGYKPWPSCAATTPYVEVALNLSEGGIDPSEVESISIKVTELGDMLCHPLSGRQKPETVSDAKFSLPFTVGLCLTRGAVEITDYTDEGIRDPKVLAMSSLVQPTLDPELSAIGPRAAAIEVILKDGSVRQGSVDVPYGLDPSRPMPPEAIVEKFRRCADAGGFSKVATDHIVELVLGIEDVQDSIELARALVRESE